MDIFHGSPTPQRLRFEKSEIFIGRAKSKNEIVIPSGYINQRGRIFVVDERLWIERLTPVHGISLNGGPLSKPQVITSLDSLQAQEMPFRVSLCVEQDQEAIRALQEEALRPEADLVSLARCSVLLWPLIASRVDALPSLLLELSTKCGEGTAIALSQNPSLPQEALKNILCFSRSLRVFENPTFPLWLLEDPMLSWLGMGLGLLLEHPQTPPELLSAFLRHSLGNVYLTCLNHPNLPEEALFEFLKKTPNSNEQSLRFFLEKIRGRAYRMRQKTTR